LRRAVRRALLTSALAVAAPAAWAQSAEAPGSELEDVVVTGSRIAVDRELAASSPVQTISLDDIRATGNVTLEDTLNQLPQLKPDNTGTVNQSGGAGVLSANLRALGAVRTLVLVDGRRYIPADVTGLVDLATIPEGLVERVEVLTGGASAIYGSDAVGGAVNFILRRDFEGLETRVQYGSTAESDGQSRKYDLLFGANLDEGRGNVTIHGSYINRDPVFMANREFSRQPFLADGTGRLNPFGSGNIPGGVIGLNAVQLAQIQGVPNLLNQNSFCPGPIQGVRFGDNGVPLPFCRPTEQYNYAAVNYLQRPLEQWQISALGNYKVSDRVEAFGQFFYTKKVNEFQQAPEAVSPTGSGQASGTVLITNADTNPLFPVATRNFFAANRAFFDPDGDGIFTVRSTQRRFEEFGPRNSSYTADSMAFTAGLRGDFAIGDDTWRWDAYAQFARSDVELLQQGLLSRSRTTLGLDTVLVNGQPQCRSNLLNCVPVNIFGTNTLTPAMANFLKVNTGRADQFDRKSAGASITGNVFELPAGAVGAAFGAEWREEKFLTVPDEISRSGDLAAATVAPQINGGQVELWEVFAEFRVPLLKDIPAIDSLVLELAARRSDYDTIGAVNTWKANLDWGIIDGVKLRGGINRAIRAPNLNELFQTPTSLFTGGTDPCWAIRNPSAAVRAFCVQTGVPTGVINTFAAGASQGWFTRSGGNPALQEEVADTITAGIVLTPDWLFGVQVSVDYFDIKVEDAIASVSSQQLVNACYTTLDANSAPCRAIVRLPVSGQIDTVAAPLLNLASRTVTGIDLRLAYRLEAPSWLSLPNSPGSFQFTYLGTLQREDTTASLPTLPVVDCAGRYEGSCSGDGTRITPDYRALFRVGWESGPLRLGVELQTIGDLELAPGAANQNGTVPAWNYVDVNFGYEVTEKIRLSGGVTNLTDKQPPVLGFTGGGDSNTNIPLYDPLGRRYFLGATVSF
jgi:outer membrane receptor protein involved in Fe transport